MRTKVPKQRSNAGRYAVDIVYRFRVYVDAANPAEALALAEDTEVDWSEAVRLSRTLAGREAEDAEKKG